MTIEGCWEKVFLGAQYGIGLSKRGPDDLHVCLTILHEDDEYWKASKDSVSSYWTSDLVEVLQTAQDWLIRYCIPDMHKGVQFGYRFRE